jgi:hypothetical protein
MRAIFASVVLLTFLMAPALARDNDDFGKARDNDWKARDNDDHGKGGYHGAPAPIAGAGLPAIAIGYGVYWIVKRRRRQTDVLKD